MSKAFISFAHADDKKRKDLHLILEQHGIAPIVVSDRKEPAKYLSDKVKEALEEADYQIPIFTKHSIINQWVNQEVGYVHCLLQQGKIKIYPIVESSIMNDLKGFVHNQIEVITFKSHPDPGTETFNFKKACFDLVEFLNDQEPFLKKEFDIEVSFSYLNMECIDQNGSIKLGSSMTIENKGKSSILIKNIDFELPYEHYNPNFQKMDIMPFELDYYYDGDKSHHLKATPVSIAPSESFTFYKMKFRSSYTMYFLNGMQNSDYRPFLEKLLKKINEVKGNITFHNNKKMDIVIPIY